ncbi:MAG: nucleotidyltransferase family protein [Faecalimonas sp.]|nr:nucleotidyltransferase family protein [Faecalimonas sp.]
MNVLEKNTYTVVTKMIRAALFDGALSDVYVEDWEDVCRELEAQTILSVCAGAMDAATPKMPEALRRKRLIQAAANVHLFNKNLAYQDEAVQALQNKGIPVAVLKGAVAAVNYPEPEHRTLGDIDLLIRAEDFARARDILLSIGYCLQDSESGEIDESIHQKHLGMRKDKIALELHVGAFQLADRQLEDKLNARMADGLAEIEWISVAGHKVPSLPMLQNALEFLLHVQGHLCSEGIGLRQILDWMLFVHRHLPDAVYGKELQSFLQSIGLEQFAKVLTRMCQLYLGLPEEHITWCKDADEAVCAELLAYIFQQGNFGHKNVADNGARALARLQSPIGFLKSIQGVGLINFPKLRKHKLLRYFAWVPQLGRYFGYVLSGKSKLSEDMKDARRRSELFRKLELFEGREDE